MTAVQAMFTLCLKEKVDYY